MMSASQPRPNVRRLCTLALALCAVLIVPRLAVSHVQPPPLSGPQHRGEVKALAAGKILVASRDLLDPNFLETVILLVDFSPKGVVGLVLNRESDVPLSRVFTGPEGLHVPRSLLFRGGPVEVQGILGLVRGTAGGENLHIARDVYLVNSRESLEALAATGATGDRFRVYSGYAGWGAEQLQMETVAGAWAVLDADAKIVFDRNPDTLWDRLIRRAGGLQARSQTPDATVPIVGSQSEGPGGSARYLADSPLAER